MIKTDAAFQTFPFLIGKQADYCLESIVTLFWKRELSLSSAPKLGEFCVALGEFALEHKKKAEEELIEFGV